MVDHVAFRDKCYKALQDSVGEIGMEWFIHDIQTRKQDYTEWQREHYDAIPDEEIRKGIRRNAEEHPLKYEKAVEI